MHTVAMLAEHWKGNPKTLKKMATNPKKPKTTIYEVWTYRICKVVKCKMFPKTENSRNQTNLFNKIVKTLYPSRQAHQLPGQMAATVCCFAIVHKILSRWLSWHCVHPCTCSCTHMPEGIQAYLGTQTFLRVSQAALKQYPTSRPLPRIRVLSQLLHLIATADPVAGTGGKCSVSS